MPYIPKNARGSAAVNPINKAELTYAISRHIHRYVERYGKGFDSMSDALVALEASKLEFYRTVVGPYEEQKRTSNGSISSLDQVTRPAWKLGAEPLARPPLRKHTGPEVLKMAKNAFPQPKEKSSQIHYAEDPE